MTDILIKGGIVVTMDPQLGNLHGADVLLRGGRIVAVAKGIEANDAEIIDAAGAIVLPGFVDCHRHVWQSMLRGVVSDASLPEYMVLARSMYCGCFDANAAYLANYLGGLESIDAGITTLVDHCHLQINPNVSIALADGLADSGVGGFFCYALQNVPDYHASIPDNVDAVRQFLMSFPDDWHDASAAGVKARLLERTGGRIRFGVALPEASPYLPAAMSKDIFARVNALQPDLITGHWNSSVQDGRHVSSLQELESAGVFDRRLLFTHCNQCNENDLIIMKRAGIALCTCAHIESGMALGPQLAFRMIGMGGHAALGTDIASYFKPDMLAEARIALLFERTECAVKGGSLPREITPSSRDALQLITIEAARALGADQEIGSLSPGKRGDVVLIRHSFPGYVSDMDPERAAIFYTSTEGIDTVISSGVVRKRNGALVGVDINDLQSRRKSLVDSINKLYAVLPHDMLQSAWKGMF